LFKIKIGKERRNNRKTGKVRHLTKNIRKANLSGNSMKNSVSMHSVLSSKN
jgi:hypothetical protein